MSVTKRETLFFSPEISPSMVFHYLEKFHFSSLFDPMTSTSGVAGYFKLQNVRVISNDQAYYAYTRGKALWENNIFYIPDETGYALWRKGIWMAWFVSRDLIFLI